MLGIGSVMATKCSPSPAEPMSWWPACSTSQKCARKASVSVVVPDLVAMMYSVVSGSEGRRRRRDRLGIGRVEDADRHGPFADRVGQPEDLGRQRAAAHAADQGAVEAAHHGARPRTRGGRRSRAGSGPARRASRAVPRSFVATSTSSVQTVVSRSQMRVAQRSSTAARRAASTADRSPAGDPKALDGWRVVHDDPSVQAVGSARSLDPSWPFDLPWSSGGGETTPRIVPVRTPRATWATAASVKPKASKIVAAGAEAP